MDIMAGLLTGILLGFRGQRAQVRSPLLSIVGVIESRHSIPGRERFYLKSLRNSKERKELILREMPKLKGITLVKASEHTGSVLIHYDSSTISPPLLAAALIKLLGLDKEIGKPSRSRVRNNFNLMVGSLNRAIYDRSRGLLDLSTSIGLLMAILAARNIVFHRGSFTPPSMALLLWAYDFLREKQ